MYYETIFCKSENEKVMKDKKNNRTRLVGVRFSVEEYEQLKTKFHSTTSRQLSDYIRRILLNKKVMYLPATNHWMNLWQK